MGAATASAVANVIAPIAKKEVIFFIVEVFWVLKYFLFDSQSMIFQGKITIITNSL